MSHTIGSYTVEEVESEYKLLITAFLDGYVGKEMRDDARMSLNSILAYAMSCAETEGDEFARENPTPADLDH